MDNEDFAQNFDFTATAFADQWTLQELSEVVKQSGTSLRSTNVNFVAVYFIRRLNGRKTDVLVILAFSSHSAIHFDIYIPRLRSSSVFAYFKPPKG